jgi:hypothetical protein
VELDCTDIFDSSIYIYVSVDTLLPIAVVFIWPSFLDCGRFLISMTGHCRMNGVGVAADVVTVSRKARKSAFSTWVAGERCSTTLLLVCLLYISINADLADAYTDAYEQLVNYGFPIGLLPQTVTGYELAENGKFAVYLESECQIDIPAAFPVIYSTKIAGNLSYGKLRNLSGIQVRIAKFVWFSITAITVQNDDLRFEVGIISASYPIHPNFDENPYCVDALSAEEQLLYLDE